jgi:vacuolar-type H+-ATPase subunit E/Vma4
VGYHELLTALEDEVERQIRRIEADADETCRRVDAKIHRELAARREAALVAEARRLDEEAQRAVSHARFEEARMLLVEQRRLLADLRQEAERRLPALDEAALAARLVDDIAPELGDGPVELRVNAGREAAFVDALSRRHPELARRAIVTAVEGMGGGVVAALDNGRQLLDNSLPSRLEKAWQQLEGELAAELFGEVTDGSRV